jgi:hypothetical protein
MNTKTARELLGIVESECPEVAEGNAREIIRGAFTESPSWALRVRRGVPLIEHAVTPVGADDPWIEATVSVERFFRHEMWEIYEKELDDAAKVRLAKTLERAAKRIRATLPNTVVRDGPLGGRSL